MSVRGLVCTGTLLGLVALGTHEIRAEGQLEGTTERGPVTASVRLEPAQPVIGDVLELTLTVRAEPDVELLMPAFGEALERYSIVDFVPREKIDDQGHTHAIQRYRLQPAHSGPQSIPSILVEFVDHRPGHPAAPEGEDAYELLTERIEFDVASVLPQGALPDLRPAQGPLPRRAAPAAPVWPWLLGAAALLVLAAPFLLRAWLRWSRSSRRRSAYELARARLDRLMLCAHPTDREATDVFFVELSDIARHYLEDRFELRSPEFTTEEFLEQMSASPDLGSEHQGLLREFLRRADLVKFAQYLPGEEDTRNSVASIERFLEETRENAPLIDVPELNEQGALRA